MTTNGINIGNNLSAASIRERGEAVIRVLGTNASDEAKRMALETLSKVLSSDISGVHISNTHISMADTGVRMGDVDRADENDEWDEE